MSLLLVLFGGWLTSGGALAQAPTVVSATPADGAVEVAGATPIVIVFDRDMDTVFPVLGGVGNLAMVPSSLTAQTSGTWGGDRRTLTLQPFFGPWPINVTITWTLNPAGVNPLFQVKGGNGVALGTVSRSFTTGVGAPGMGAVTPADNTEIVPTNTAVTFRFTQAMKKIVLPGAPSPSVKWTGIGLDTAKFRYAWSVDGRSLTAEYDGGFPRKTRVDWELNPVGASIVFESQTGKPMPTGIYHGGFTTAATVPCTVIPFPTWGSYGVNKRSGFQQTSSADPVESSKSDEFPASHIFSTVVQSPAFGPNVTAASIQLPDGTRTNLTNFGLISYYEVKPTEAALDAAFPVGTYTLRFTQTGLPEHVIAMNMTASDLPPVPTLANYTAAQSIEASRNFTLSWKPFSNADADDLISLLLYNDEGGVVFQAPDYCLPIPLKPTETSVVIPADTLIKDHTYNGELLFGKSFYSSTNTVPEMWGYGYRLRATHFTVSTGSGGNPDQPAVVFGVRVQPGGKAAFDLKGTATRTYGVQRADQLDAATWTEVGTVVMDAAGAGGFVDPQPLGVSPRLYRVVGK